MSKIDLQELAEELRTQDNLGTAEPIFLVMEKERVYGFQSEYSDDYIWVESGYCDCEFESLKEVNEYLQESRNSDKVFVETEDQAEEEGFEKVYYLEKNRFKCSHFTRKAAELYIAQNSHNLRKPFVYVGSMYGCYEMIAIREFLMNPQDTSTALTKLSNRIILSTYDPETKCCKICGAGDDGEHDANCPAYVAAKFVADWHRDNGGENV